MQQKIIDYGTTHDAVVLSAKKEVIIVKGIDNNEGYVLIGHRLDDASLPAIGNEGTITFTKGGPEGGYWKWEPDPKTIKICTCHEQQVPLIWTFAFDGSEYWCPGCGYNAGMMGAGKNVPFTKELKALKKDWVKKSEEFLTAKSTLVCHSLIWEGKEIKRSELPQEEVNRCKKVVEDWKYLL
jgi:hypothetical protein